MLVNRFCKRNNRKNVLFLTRFVAFNKKARERLGILRLDKTGMAKWMILGTVGRACICIVSYRAMLQIRDERISERQLSRSGERIHPKSNDFFKKRKWLPIWGAKKIFAKFDTDQRAEISTSALPRKRYAPSEAGRKMLSPLEKGT